MTNTHHIHWLTNTSVTIRKGKFEVTLGPKEQPKAVQSVPAPTVSPAKKPWTLQEIAFIMVVSVALVLAGRWLWKQIDFASWVGPRF